VLCKKYVCIIRLMRVMRRISDDNNLPADEHKLSLVRANEMSSNEEMANVRERHIDVGMVNQKMLKVRNG